MSKHILLTGGTGLIGSKLTNTLLDQGYNVSHLSRTPGNDPRVRTYLWDIHKGEIDKACINGVDTIVHLAGAGIADERWTGERKKELLESRTKSIALIYGLLKREPHTVKSVISASGSGYYGDRGDELLTEDSGFGSDFLAEVCMEWEAAVDKGMELGLRVVKIRTGVVLTKNGGALPKMALPVKLWVGAPLGNGRQWMPWIHEHDVVKMYLFAISRQELAGTFNMAAPQPATNKQFTQAIAKHLHKPLWVPNVPAFVIRLLFGEMAVAVLESERASAQKILDAGFVFEYPELDEALKEIYGS